MPKFFPHHPPEVPRRFLCFPRPKTPMSMIESSSLSLEYQDLNVNYYVSLVALSILYYDYALTFGLEVSRFWVHRGFSWAAFFFYLNRYLGIFGHIPVVVENFWTGSPSNKDQMSVVSAHIE
ncbi:hypothetical protein IW261DRAFT_675606 [Armillaria novae-zelandiae]|uniref:DUF6533 domain-containing protein n=1 Tax=Armillaria novae-zelandiae TaxID=153914 RepID=A0AA39NXK6_9AGAR|nr:hypothetical protein IW261DRAFT_675606 [Armillaria novae-zelandiae]